MKRRAEKCAIFCPVALQGKKKVICINSDFNLETATKICKEMSRKVFIEWLFGKGTTSSKESFVEAEQEKSQGTCCETFLLFFYNIYESFLLL